ncbi:ATP-binding protein [Anaerocolumna xylanovorans]|uniref:AAA domain-containing protein n=1 Tax=Anaerocolumna xylanovorans DSM 12503 TaxID=1121345 RepID=A0A1M7Y699_9FIRM|nr:AAA family ATPase [Anaerocolumna xylanovorans]SHO48177.1 AAA domain-containing protein [Anaerocolumna xylanovorans DSM 12503]
MQFRELKITDFGKFHQKNISLKEGINLVYGENETGKSTVHAFIRGMLFGIEKPRGRVSKEDIYTRYQPWDTPALYRGSLDFTLEGKEYRIIRNLEKNQKNTTLLDLETGRELGNDNSKIRELLGGLTESGYINTVSIEQQKIRTGTELAGEVRNYITNLSLAKNNEVDVNKALTFLQGKKKELEGKRPLKELKETKELIEKGKVLEQRADSLMDQLNAVKCDFLAAEERLNHQKNDNAEREETPQYDEALLRYPLMQNKLENYEKKKEQIRELREKADVLRTETAKTQYPGSNELKKDMEAIKNTVKEREEIEAEKEHLLLEASEKKSRTRKALTGASLLFLAGLLSLLIGFTAHSKVWLAAIPFVLAAMAVFIRFYTGTQRAAKEYEEGIKALDAKYQKNKKKIEEAFAKYNVKEEEELTVLYEASIKAEMQKKFTEGQIREYIGQEEQLKELAAEEKKELLSYLMLIPDWKEKLPDRQYEPEEEDLLRVKSFFTGKKEEQQRAKEELYKERDRLKLLTEQIKWELNSLADNEEELLFCQEKERELLEKEEEIKTELEAVTTAMETIKGLSQKIHDSFGTVLNRKVSCLVSELTGDKYSNIRIDENLEMKAEVGDEYKAWDRLSTGTMEQLLFALRLGVSDILYNKELPLLLDDCFAYYDDKRTRAALSYLAGSSRQILIFTCHGREREIIRELGISYNYVDLGEA